MVYKMPVCTAFCALLFWCNAVLAFDQNAVMSVKDQPSEYYQAQGGRFRSLIIEPAMAVSAQYDDNIYRQRDNKKSDLIHILTPQIDMHTDWNLHEISAGASAKIGRFNRYKKENYDDYSGYVSGRYDIDYGTYLTLNLRSEYRHEDRGNLDDVNGDAPIEYNVNTADISFTRELGILKLYLYSTARNYDYKNSVRAGVIIDNSDRNRRQFLSTIRLAYGQSDHYNLYLQGQYNRRLYDNSSASYRDSVGYDWRTGLSVNLTGKLQGDFYLGYLLQDYGAGFKDVSGVNYGGNLLWNINGITSLSAGLERQVVETTLAGSSGVLRMGGHVELQHALRENIIIEARLSALDDAYKGGGARNDNLTAQSHLGVEYRPNEVLSFGVDYDYLNRNFANRAGDYDNHKMLFIAQYAY